jgi:cytochrome c-type biogenesis protein CcmE
MTRREVEREVRRKARDVALHGLIQRTNVDAVQHRPCPRRALDVVALSLAIALAVSPLACKRRQDSSRRQDDSVLLYKTVDQAVADPAKLAGRKLRVVGLIEADSHVMRESPCEHRFVLEGGGKRLPVVYAQCVLPDPLMSHSNGVEVLVDGELRAGPELVASDVLAKSQPFPFERDARDR